MRRARLTVPLAALLGLLLLGVPAPAGAIFGGGLADPGEYPGMGLVLVLDDTGMVVSTCGGTLVAPTKVVTAAHCVVSGDLLVALGLTRLAEIEAGTAEVHDVADARAHPQWEGGLELDVAVLTLADRSGLTPVRVVGTDEGDLWAEGTSATIAGWGVVSQGGDGSDQLREATVPVRLNEPTCQSGTVFCAGDGDPAVCPGDSGGPLLVHDNGDPVLAGVIVGATAGGCGGGDNQPDFYAKIGAEPLHGWLTDEIADTVAPSVVDHAPTGRRVERGATVKAVLDEPVARSTVDAGTFRLSRVTDDGLRRVRDAAVTLSADRTVARLDPDLRLRARTRYRAHLSTAVQDLAGNRLDQDASRDGRQPQVWTFTTGR